VHRRGFGSFGIGSRFSAAITELLGSSTDMFIQLPTAAAADSPRELLLEFPRDTESDCKLPAKDPVDADCMLKRSVEDPAFSRLISVSEEFLLETVSATFPESTCWVPCGLEDNSTLSVLLC